MSEFDPNNISITKAQIALITAARGKLLLGPHRVIDRLIASRGDDGLYHGRLVLVETDPNVTSVDEVTLDELGLSPGSPVEYDDDGKSGLEDGDDDEIQPIPPEPSDDEAPVAEELADDDDSTSRTWGDGSGQEPDED